MTTNETVFFIRGGYILLVDLESWYNNGFVTSEDEFECLMGRKNEFVRLKTSSRIMDVDFHSVEATTRLLLMILVMESVGLMDLIDYPLLNVENEEDMITVNKVLKEFHKLRQTWVLRNWNSDYAEYFEYLDRGYKGNGFKRTQPICRICKETPKHLMEHLFGSFHTLYMKNYSVSLRSFEFWCRKLQECLEKCGKIPGVDIRNYEQGTQEVDEILTNKKEQKKEKMLEENEIVLPSYSRSQVLAERSLNRKFELNLSEDILKELGRTHLIDYPLLNVDNEPEEDRITGRKVLKKFNKLRQAWVIQNWNSKYAEYFEYLDKGYKGKPICRVCKKQPKNMMKHLLLIPHAVSLSRYSVSRRSFEFWSQKLQECLEKCGKIPGVHIFSYEQIVLQDVKDQKEQKKEMLQENEIVLPSYSRSQVLAERSLNRKFELNLSEDILKELGRTPLIDYPLLNVDNERKEDRITENSKLELSINDQLTETFNDEKIEIEEIATISPSYSRSQLLALRSLKTTVNLNLSEEILKDLGPMDLIDYPLLNVDNEPEEDRITGDSILKEFDKLKQSCVIKHWNVFYALHFEFLARGYKGDGLKMTQPICRICNMTPEFALEHLFSYKHKEKLKSHSVSLRSFEFWSQKFRECIKRTFKVASVSVTVAQPLQWDKF
ncbi:Protein CBG00286 [Caenorhabditis briggsae]|uniref:Protein CBG00286 n=1 Tax=Caenorhabditis briggsae TaxID=6238 RepID=A8WMM0_CAEBR|nr:Protein CBG00286 [Caenorhabditis briggsae]CAP21725.2 Protein CBG00286 [Caenorhabditis briggsae]